MDTPERPSQRCPTCGTELSGTSWFCGACGGLLATVPASGMSDTTRPIVAVVPGGGAGSGPTTPTTMPPGSVATATTRRCERCGASNPLEATRCGTCHAELA